MTQPINLVKVGIKGPALTSWAQAHDLHLPGNLYDVLRLDEASLLARVGNEEIILECGENDPLLLKLEETFLRPPPDLYRIEQQSVTIDLKGDLALRVLSQTCGIDLAEQQLDRMLYSRIAGVSTAVILRNSSPHRVYRFWVEYMLAQYLWETLTEIIDEF